MTIPLRFASLYDGQEVFVWSDCLLDLGTDSFALFQSPGLPLFLHPLSICDSKGLEREEKEGKGFTQKSAVRRDSLGVVPVF